MLQEFYTSWISRPTTPSWRYPWKVIIPEGATIPESLYRHPGGQFVVNKIQGCHHQSLNAAYAPKTLLRITYLIFGSRTRAAHLSWKFNRSDQLEGGALEPRNWWNIFFLVRGGRFNIQYPENEYIAFWSPKMMEVWLEDDFPNFKKAWVRCLATQKVHPNRPSFGRSHDELFGSLLRGLFGKPTRQPFILKKPSFHAEGTFTPRENNGEILSYSGHA